MKTKSIIITASIFCVLLLTGCGHSVSMLGVGTGWRAGGGEYGISYGEGLFGTFVTKDGVSFKAELDSTQGFSYNPSSGTYKGIKSIAYDVAPQINGYAVEFAKENPEVAKAYYDALVRYYDSREKNVITTAPMISEEKSKSAMEQIAEAVKKAVAKAKELIEKKENEEGAEAVFQCDGNCVYEDLTGNPNIEYQLSIAMKLLTYDGYSNKMQNTGEYYTTVLEHFVTKLVQHQSKGNKETPLRIKYVTVQDKVITKLMFAYFQEDGQVRLEDCPSCVSF